MRRLHLHIGPRKSGTTYLQNAMVAGDSALRAAGLTYPQRVVTGVLGLNHEAALLDASSGEPGTSAAALRSVLGRTDSDVVLSGEAIATLTPSAAARLVAHLGADDIHVVITARAISRVVPSTWQQGVRNGRLTSFTTFLDHISRLDDERAAAPDSWQEDPAQEFWRSHAIADLAARWRDACGSVTVVTVPPDSTSPTTLWQRFLSAMGVDLDDHPDLRECAPAPRHEGISASEALLLREIMLQLDRGGLDVRNRSRWARRLVSDVFRQRAARGAPLALPADRWSQALHWADQDIAHLQELTHSGRVRIIGSESDLRGAAEPPAPAVDSELAREIADLGGQCIAYLQGVR